MSGSQSRIKPVIWIGSSRDDLRTFPPSARRNAGHQLENVQLGLDPKDWKPMGSIGPGVQEIRIRDSAGAFRIIYLTARPEGIYVLHCFQKKDRKTRKQDMDLAKARLKDIPKAGEGSHEGIWPSSDPR